MALIEGDKKNILDEYARDFQENNPNLVVYNSVLHMNEASRGLKKKSWA
jgi:hypothetical protein